MKIEADKGTHTVVTDAYIVDYWKVRPDESLTACGWKEDWTRRSLYIQGWQYTRFDFSNSDEDIWKFDELCRTLTRVYERGIAEGKSQVRKALGIFP